MKGVCGSAQTRCVKCQCVSGDLCEERPAGVWCGTVSMRAVAYGKVAHHGTQQRAFTMGVLWNMRHTC